MSWTIVPYQDEHAESLRLVYRQARQVAFPWVDPLSLQLADFDEVIQGETVLVALGQGGPVGFVAWWPPDIFVHSLFVSPAQARKGIGRALLGACLEQLGRPATLKCKVANQQALQFYDSLGWLPIDEAEGPQGRYRLLIYDE